MRAGEEKKRQEKVGFCRHQNRYSLLSGQEFEKASTVDGVAANTGYTKVDLGSQHTTQAIYKFKVLDDRTKAVATNFGVQGVDDDFNVIAT